MLALSAGGIDLDALRPKLDNVDGATWVQHVLSGNAVEFVQQRIAEDGIAIVAGVAAWPAMAEIIDRLRVGEVRRAFVKRVTVINGHKFWDEGSGAAEFAQECGSYYLRSYYEYLARDETWQAADIVIERIERNSNL